MKKQEGEEGLHLFCPVLVLQDLKDGMTGTDEGPLAVEEGAPEDVMQDVVIYVLTTPAVAFSKVELLVRQPITNGVAKRGGDPARAAKSQT
ncbi:hypothetical protein AVEN_158703-1 [Araneus ventricosus]|uniref:Uncharacterized protein n=1 Tax=Araneus ventricosus TaxID=182803 RepID=A0A4Y2W1E8_ARAVE|nr:hypothetical protein AVEN_158703-1 [Araneus ventricosus]